MPIHIDDFKTVMSKFSTGVTIVTSTFEGSHHGLTVNAFCSVSLSPPLVLICIEKGTKGHLFIEKSGRFAVNMLSSQQVTLSRRFSDPETDTDARFRGVDFALSANGLPWLSGAIAHLDCRIHQSYDGGDHTIFVGEVMDLQTDSEPFPLIYFNQIGRAHV